MGGKLSLHSNRVESVSVSEKSLHSGVTLCGALPPLLNPLPRLVPLPWRQPAGQSVLNYNYLCMTKGHETCLMTHLPQSRTKRAADADKTRRVRQGVENGKEPERGSYHALPAKPKGAGQGRVGKVGRVGSSVVLCSVCLCCQPGWGT